MNSKTRKAIARWVKDNEPIRRSLAESLQPERVIQHCLDNHVIREDESGMLWATRFGKSIQFPEEYHESLARR